MSVSVALQTKLQATETLENTPSAPSASKVVIHSSFDTLVTLNAGSTPTATKCAYAEVALVAGAKTIDLTALTGTNGAVINGNGLKVRAIRFKNKSENANVMTIAQGAANPYTGLGATYSFALQPGQDALFYLASDAPDVGGACKNIDVAGTGAQVFQLTVIFG